MELKNKISQRPYKEVYAEDGMIIKVFTNKYAKDAIFNEALNQTRLEASHLHVPPIIRVEEIDGRWAIFSKQIQGKTLEQILQTDPSRTQEVLELFVGLLIEMQSQKVEFLNPLKVKLIQKLDRSPLQATMRFAFINDFKALPQKKQVVHGDFNPENIILGEDNQLYLFDWAHVTEGNGLYDVAKTYLWLNIHQHPQFARDFVAAYCEKSGTNPAEVAKWLPLVAASIIGTAATPTSRKYLETVIFDRHPEVK